MIKRKAEVVQTSTNTNIHNTNVTGIVNKRFDEPMRYGQGHYVETMKEYAQTSISEEDAGRMRCGTFGAFKYVCHIISTRMGIKHTKVYPALRVIGYNWRYHDMKTGNPDVLYEQGSIVKRCKMGDDPGLLPFVTSSDGLFPEGKVIQYRIVKTAIEQASDLAEECGVRLSELNLFDALQGLDVLVNNEPDYILMRDDLYFDETMSKFSFLKRRLTARCKVLNRMVG